MAHLLIVDDDPLIRRALVRILVGVHTCVTACNGIEAIQYLWLPQAGTAEVIPFDLIISDVDMPIMSGLDLYHWVTNRYPRESHKIVFHTSSNVQGLEGLGVPILPKDGDLRKTVHDIANHLLGSGVAPMRELA